MNKTCLQDYQVICPLGRGAYSQVYKVKSRHNHSEFALKIIQKAKLSQSKISKRLMNEIQLQSKLNHPCIVKLFHFFQDEQNVYLLLQLCSGGELFTYVRNQGPLFQQQAKSLLSQLVEGMTFLHSQGILHRDLKLGNLLLSQDKTQLKIADFGLAVQLTDFEQQRNTLCGTPNYISPQIVSRKPYGLSSDLWSLGCIVYGCLVGYPPFQSPTIQDTIMKLKQMQYALPKNLSIQSKDLISSLLTWDSQDRISIFQVRRHSFFRNIFFQDSKQDFQPDCSYYEYSESLISPTRQPLKEINRSSLPAKSSPNLSKIAPISTTNLTAFKHQTPKGSLEITQEGWVKVSVNSRRLEVSRDGMTIVYQGRVTPLKSLTGSALKLYQYAKNFIQIVKSKTPKVTIHKENFVCMLMQNTPFPNFEMNFKNGVRVIYQVGHQIFTIFPLIGGPIKINPYQDLEHLDPQLSNIIQIAMQGLKQALIEERQGFKQKSQFNKLWIHCVGIVRCFMDIKTDSVQAASIRLKRNRMCQKQFLSSSLLCSQKLRGSQKK